MAGLPQTIPTPAPEALATYNYFESFTGAAYVKFYLLGTNDSVGKKYHLTTDNSIGSSNSNMQDLGLSGTINFDINIELPFRIVARDSIVSMTAKPAGDADRNITFSVIHVDSGDTETTIGTAISEQINIGGGMLTCKLAMTEKLFKRGETLRLKVTASDSLEAYWDPIGRTSITEHIGNATVTSTSTLLLPIEIPS